MRNRNKSAGFHGGQIHYTISGKGSAVVLLHGFLGDRTLWVPWMQTLKSRYKVIAIDLPGHGASECLGYVHDMELMAKAVQAVLKQEDIRRYVLVGHSMGGYVALAMADLFPDRQKGICLFHSTAKDDSTQKKKDRSRLIRLVQHNKMLFINEAIPNLFNTAFKPHKRSIAKASRVAAKTPVQGIIAALEGMKIRQDRQVIVRFAPCPVHYIIGQEDAILDHASLITEAAASENASHTLIKNCGHMGFLEQSDESLKALKAFIQSL